MKILHLNDTISIKGGVEVYLQQLQALLPKYGCTTFWLGIEGNKNSYAISQYGVVKVEPTNTYAFQQLIRRITSFISEYEIDLIHVHSISNPKLIQALFNLRPVVRSMHEPRIVCPGHGKFWRHSERICDQPFGMHCIYHAYKEGCCNRHPKRLLSAITNTTFELSEGKNNYKAILAMSEYMQEEAFLAGFEQQQVVCNPYATLEVAEKDLKYTGEDKEKSLLFVGRLSKTKGVHYFVKAAFQLLAHKEKIRIDIVGSGQDKGFFESLIPAEFTHLFRFHGWQDRSAIAKFIDDAYLLVFPSIYPEAFGIVGIEAMMRAKPVVGFAVGGVTTWLKDGESGFAVPVKNVDCLAEKIQCLLRDENLYRQMSKSARQMAVEKFAPEVHMKKLIEVYENALLR